MSFRAICKAEVVRSVIDTLSTMVDEAKFQLSPEGITVRAVDAAHVAMVDLTLSKAAFKNYEAEETEIGLDIDKLKDATKLASADDEVEFELEDGRLKIRIGNLVRRMSLVDTGGMTDPKVPNLDLPALIRLPGNELERGIKAAEGVSDHVALTATPESFELSASGDMDSVDLKLDKAALVELTVDGEDVRSLFSLDYFSSMTKVARNAGTVTLHLGNDYPVRMGFEFANGEGSVMYLLAPRIESA